METNDFRRRSHEGQLSIRAQWMDLRPPRRLARTDRLSARQVTCERNGRSVARDQALPASRDETRLGVLSKSFAGNHVVQDRFRISTRDRWNRERFKRLGRES